MNEATCCANIYEKGVWRSHPCGRKAKVERNGMWYCGIHDPVSREKRRERNHEEWKRNWDRQERERKAREAAMDAIDRIAHADDVELALNPQWAKRLAREVMAILEPGLLQ